MAKGMSKSQIMSTLAEKSGHSRKDVSALLEAMVSLAYSEAKKAGEFTVPGLGKLVKKQRAARMGRNPATGETIKIPAKTVVKFRVAKAAKDAAANTNTGLSAPTKAGTREASPCSSTTNNNQRPSVKAKPEPKAYPT